MVCIHLAQHNDQQHSHEHGDKPLGSMKGNLLTSWVTDSFPRRTLLHGIGEFYWLVSLFGGLVSLVSELVG